MITATFILGAVTIAACWWIERYGLYAAKDVARAIRRRRR